VASASISGAPTLEISLRNSFGDNFDQAYFRAFENYSAVGGTHSDL
jgi:hypothetical protein